MLSNNRRFVRFLYDMMIYLLLPNPEIAAMLLAFTSFMSLVIVTIYFNSIFYSSVYWLVVWILVMQNLLPLSLVALRGYLILGSTYALKCSQLLGLYLYVYPKLSYDTITTYLLPITVLFVYITLKFRYSKAQTLSPISQEDLAQQIINSSSKEGPNEDGKRCNGCITS